MDAKSKKKIAKIKAKAKAKANKPVKYNKKGQPKGAAIKKVKALRHPVKSFESYALGLLVSFVVGKVTQMLLSEARGKTKSGIKEQLLNRHNDKE